MFATLSSTEDFEYDAFGLTHSGYNGEHLAFWEAPGTGIQLVPVTPDHTDTHKYKFGGKEYQTEIDAALQGLEVRIFILPYFIIV